MGMNSNTTRKAEIAKAAGPVEITLARPWEAAAALPGGAAKIALVEKADKSQLTAVAEAGQIHVKTSGLTFDQKSGIASTSQQVEFAMTKGSGSAVGATYDSQQGHLVLDHAVSIDSHRATQQVQLKAQHADFDRDSQICRLSAASAAFRGGEARAEDAKVQFREDGTVDRAGCAEKRDSDNRHPGQACCSGGLPGFRRSEPTRPRSSARWSNDRFESRRSHGSWIVADGGVGVWGRGLLHRAHLERGVRIASDEIAGSGKEASRTHRAWTSPVADLEFRNPGKGQIELASIAWCGRGCGDRREPTRQRAGGSVADVGRRCNGDIRAGFRSHHDDGCGPANIAETTATGTRQSTTGDRLDVRFVQSSNAKGPVANGTRRQARHRSRLRRFQAMSCWSSRPLPRAGLLLCL